MTKHQEFVLIIVNLVAAILFFWWLYSWGR